MKAVICEKYGSPEILNLEEIEKPDPADDELLIRVRAASVNRTDTAYIRGKPFFARLMTGLLKPKNSIPGTEFAGEVESIGNTT